MLSVDLFLRVRKWNVSVFMHARVRSHPTSRSLLFAKNEHFFKYSSQDFILNIFCFLHISLKFRYRYAFTDFEYIWEIEKCISKIKKTNFQIRIRGKGKRFF